MSVRTAFKASVFGVVLVLISARAEAVEIPSCVRLAGEMTSRGAMPDCAPMSLPNDTAFDVLEEFHVERVGDDYYVLADQAVWDDLEITAIWEMLAYSISSLQTLYDSPCDLTFMSIPSGYDAVADGLSLTSLPDDAVVARAIFKSAGELSILDEFPYNHSEMRYTLIVYQRPTDSQLE